MKRLSQSEQTAAYHIFNHVESIVGPYYGKKTQAMVQDYVSGNRWIMFPQHNISSLREGADLPMPNVFISFENEIKDDGSGLVNGWMGLTYHNIQAMQWLNDILKRKKKSLLFINILNSIGDDWSVEIQHKTKTNCPESACRYSTFRAMPPSTVTADMIIQGIKDSNKALLRSGDPYPDDGNPVLWDVTVFTVMKPTTVKSFNGDVKKSFDMLFKALTLR